MDLNEIQSLLSRGEDMEYIAEKFDWKEFEDFCAKILLENEWGVKRNFRFKTDSWKEIDLLAKKQGKVLLIDCKHWGDRKGKASQLKISARKQRQRAKEWRKVGFLDGSCKGKILPLIITLLEENIIFENGVWVVPVFKFNSFLLEIDSYFEI